MSKPFTVQWAGTVSAGILTAGAILVVVGILALVGSAFKELGNWDYWVVALGALLLLIGAVWLLSYIKSVRKFHKLMEEKSKAAFVKKQDDVEYLAWKLPMRYEDELLSKKRDFGLR